MNHLPLNPDQAVARLAGRQVGFVTLADTGRAGLSPSQVEDRVRHKGWVRWARGLYLLPGAPAETWQRAAMAGCLLAGQRAVASHMTAGALHGFCRPSLVPHITVPRPSSARTPLAIIHRIDVSRIDRGRVDGIACSSASRALVECAGLVDRASLEEMVDQAFCAGLASPESVRASLERAPARARGARLMRVAIAVWDDDIEPGSPAEVRFLRRLVEWGVRDAVTQYEVQDEYGDVVGIVDVAIPGRRHGFEYDADLFHGPRRYAHDERRHARLEALGWRIDHLSKRDLLPSASRIPELLARRRAA